MSTIFEFLDAGNSLGTLKCNDPNKLYDGKNTSISCQDFMLTPFRNVRQIVRDDGTPTANTNLPITNGASQKLINILSTNDANLLGLRMLPETYSGTGNWSSCTSASTFRLATGGFTNPNQSNLQNIWSFFRRQVSGGGTPLAWVLGFDNNNNTTGTTGGNVVTNDALGAYKTELQTDPSIQCRPEFVIVITDGEDTCSGQPNGPSGSGQTSGSLTTDANRRSSVQAVSNLRTYYSVNAVQNNGKTYKKEIFTFVIGVGIQDPVAMRTLNAIALAGGTSTQGLIKHIGPDGNSVGTVDITDPSIFPQGSQFAVFQNLATVNNINNNAAAARLTGCQSNQVSETGQCSYQGVNIFNNTFFDTGAPFNNTNQQLQNFAFFANDPQELLEALKTAINIIQVFSTSGVSPTAPQSSTAVALRDRIFLSILTPITTDRLWQGRLGLYGFVDLPGVVGDKVVIRKPPAGSDITNANVVKSLEIYDNDGTLNDKATQFYWEAGKNLTERDIVSSPRNLYTVVAPDLIPADNNGKSPFSGSNYNITGNVITYQGPLVPLNNKNSPLNPGEFGISNSDVTNPIPGYCVPPAGTATQCNGSTGIVDCSNVTTSACQTCVKNCIRDQVINFLIGNTGIPTVGDPMGSPSIDQQPSQVDGTSPSASMGYNCPDPEDQNGDGNLGSLDTCSVRLGDIFHSNPVVVGSPSSLYFDVGYQQFAAKYKDRSAIVYVGANDGFIHAFHAGEYSDPNAVGAQAEDKTNPFTLKTETFPFFDAGTGFEVFGVATPTYLPDSLAQSPSTAFSPAYTVFGTPVPPDYRSGDFKTFVLNNFAERSFSDGSPVIGDVFIDGFSNGIQLDANPPTSCQSVDTPDGNIDPCGREWHTVLLAGSQNGGGSYMALDVTNPACGENCGTTDSLHEHISGGSDTLEYPKHLWTIFDNDFGNSWSTPSIGRIKLNITQGQNTQVVDRWVMFVGGGLDPLDTDPTNGVQFGNAFAVIDISTGKEIFKFHPTHPIPSGTSAPANINQMVCDVPSRVAAVDINSDGYTDLVYFGDNCGRMWRFDVSMPIDVMGNISQSGPNGDLNIVADKWTGQVVFCANTDAQCLNAQKNPAVPQTNLEPIYFAPTIVLDNFGRRHVIFVTGDRRDPSNSSESGKLYNFIDEYIPAFLAGGTAQGNTTIKTASTLISENQVITLKAQSGVNGQFVSSVGTNFSSTNGEFLVIFPGNVANPPLGEKGFGVPVVINSVLIFTTYTPPVSSSNPCTSGTGFGQIYALDFIAGSAALTRIPGVYNSNILKGTTQQNVAAAGVTVAQGMPTPAQLTFGTGGSVLMSVAFTGGPVAGGSQFIVWELPPLPTRTQTLFWEEVE
ncbi:MAG: pilus assembly protein [Thermodesulfobacteriota bacterium]